MESKKRKTIDSGNRESDAEQMDAKDSGNSLGAVAMDESRCSGKGSSDLDSSSRAAGSKKRKDGVHSGGNTSSSERESGSPMQSVVENNSEVSVDRNTSVSNGGSDGDSSTVSSNLSDAVKNSLICPSPIRGLLNDPPSVNASDKPDACLDSSKEGHGSFSFHTPEKSSVVQPGNGVGSDSDQARCVDETGTGEVVPLPRDSALVSRGGRKLLVLDLNGLLCDIVQDFRKVRHFQKPYKKVSRKAVFKRPYCDDFLRFCFERFDVGIWSSRKKCNVDGVVDYLMGDAKDKLLFCWDLSRCTDTGFKTIENAHKALVLKELKKLWNKECSELPWENGEYSPSNTLLVDDSPYKALQNPPHTAIFPHPYHVTDANDSSLGPEGDLRMYLEGLAVSDDVQQYVQKHPYGQPAITDTHKSWKFYHKIIDKVKNDAAEL